MAKALVIVFSNFRNDARVRRQVNWLKKRFQTTVVCFDADDVEGVTFVRVAQTSLTLWRKALLGAALLLRRFQAAYSLFHDYGHVVDALKKENFDLIIANDVDALPLAFDIKTSGRVIFDAHEYAPRHFENKMTWRLFFQPFNIYLCRRYIPRVDAMLTVGKGLADEYAKNFPVSPVIITNAAVYHDIPPGQNDSGVIRLIHHGIANQSRRLELMIEMMGYLDDRFSLDMMLMTSDYASSKTKSYIEQLKEQVSGDSRIRILPSVQSSEVVRTINSYDIGVFLIPPVNFNYANTLPNKLFDFIQARLGVAIGPTPEMAKIVRTYELGVVSESFEAKALADKLKPLTREQVNNFKANSARAARELNAETNEKIFNQLLDSLLK